MFQNQEMAFGGFSNLYGLVDGIYQAASTPELWPEVLESIRAVTDGHSIAWYAGFTGELAPQLLAMNGIEPSAWEDYASYYTTINPLIPRAERLFSPQEVWSASRAMPLVEFERTEYYQDFFRPLGWQDSIGLRIDLPGHPPATLTLQREKSQGIFHPEHELALLTLRPHLERALELHLRLAEMQAQLRGLEAALSAFDHAVFGLDARSKVVFSNHPAQQLVAHGDTLRLAFDRLSAIDFSVNTQLQLELAKAVATPNGAGLHAGNSLMIPRHNSAQPLRLTISPFRSPQNVRSEGLAALVFVSDPTRQPLSRSAILRTLYQLTPAEQRTADLLLQGLDANEIADQTHTRIDSVRFQIKRVMAKTNTRRQSELIRLILSLPGTLPVPQPGSKPL